MKLTLLVKLAPNPEQHAALLATLVRFNLACNAAATVAFEQRMANKVALQKLVYRDLRERFGLSSQMAVRAIAKVVEAYKRDRSILPVFGPHGAMVYDQRIMSWKGLDRVSLLTLEGRKIIPVLMGAYQTARLDRIRGQADLLYRDGTFFLAVTLDVPEGTPYEPADFLGVDLGIVNIAADSQGEVYSGGQLNGLRKRHARLRQRLQKRGTRSATRLLRKRRRKEERFARNVNHIISKQVVANAHRHRLGIALEDLPGIRERTTVQRAHRRQHHAWAFHQLRSFIEYKARLSGVPVVLVDPRNTSRTCPACGHVAKANRRTQSQFLCVVCGYGALADYVAAVNISRRAAVNQPDVADFAV